MALKEPGFAERLQTAAEAKQAQMEEMRAIELANMAQSAERQAARVETAKARQIRTVERESAKRAAAERRDAERAAEKARQARAVTDEKARKDAERVAQAEADAVLTIFIRRPRATPNTPRAKRARNKRLEITAALYNTDAIR